MQTLSTASAIVDREMQYVVANTRWRELYGLGNRPLKGLGLDDANPPVFGEVRAIHERCLAGESVRSTASRFERNDGTVEYIDLVAAPWEDGSGDIVGVAIHANVVTDQVQTRRKLMEERAFVDALVKKSPVGFNLCRFDGLWLESNPAFLDIIGYTAEEADGGLTYWQLTPPEYAEAEKEQLASLETEGRYGPYEKEFIRKDGTRVPVRLNGFTIERDGEKYIWSLIEEITGERALEAQAEQERLRALQASKLAAIGEMAAGIAHEINNPLQIIDGFAYELQESLAAGETPPAEAVEMIRHATERAARIVRGLRKFARDDAGDIGPHVIEDLVEEAMSLTAARMRNHGVSLDVDVRSTRLVQCTSLEMTQVLVNLLNNAFDAVRSQPGVGLARGRG